MAATQATRLIHTRPFGFAVGVVAFIALTVFFCMGLTGHIDGNRGFVLPSANMWIETPWLDFLCSLAGSALVIVLMWALSKVYNVFRSVTGLYMAFFAFMQLAVPALSTQFYTGTLLSTVIPVCMLLLFSSYRSTDASSKIFLIFFLLSLCAATQYCFAIYTITFLIGCAQMRIFNRRTLLAAFMGIITPWWIMLGFGIISLENIHMPSLVSIFSVIDYQDSLMLLITIGVTTLIMLGCYILNVLKTIAYNARARAVNGAFTITGLTTLIALGVDYPNIISYVPLLNFCAAMEATHFFSTHRADKSFIAILIILAIYAAIFVCQTAI